MSAPIRVKVEADDATQDQWRAAETAVETNNLNPGTGPENEHSSPAPLVVRTLKPPPEIWELVHQTPGAFTPGGAFVTRLTSSKTNLIMLTLAVVFLSGLCFFAVTTLRDGGNRAGAAAQVQDERGTSQAIPASQASAPVSAPVAAPVDAQLNTQLTEPVTGDGVNNTLPQPTVSQPTNPQANPASADQALTDSVQPTGESVSSFSKLSASGGADAFSGNKRVAVGSGWRNAGNSPRVRREPAAAPVTSAAPPTSQAAGVKDNFAKSSSESVPAKTRSDTTSNPPSIAPPTTTSSAPNANAPKAKVIQWP